MPFSTSSNKNFFVSDPSRAITMPPSKLLSLNIPKAKFNSGLNFLKIIDFTNLNIIVISNKPKTVKKYNGQKAITLLSQLFNIGNTFHNNPPNIILGYDNKQYIYKMTAIRNRIIYLQSISEEESDHVPSFNGPCFIHIDSITALLSSGPSINYSKHDILGSKYIICGPGGFVSMSCCNAILSLLLEQNLLPSNCSYYGGSGGSWMLFKSLKSPKTFHFFSKDDLESFYLKFFNLYESKLGSNVILDLITNVTKLPVNVLKVYDYDWKSIVVDIISTPIHYSLSKSISFSELYIGSTYITVEDDTKIPDIVIPKRTKYIKGYSGKSGVINNNMDTGNYPLSLKYDGVSFLYDKFPVSILDALSATSAAGSVVNMKSYDLNFLEKSLLPNVITLSPKISIGENEYVFTADAGFSDCTGLYNLLTTSIVKDNDNILSIQLLPKLTDNNVAYNLFLNTSKYSYINPHFTPIGVFDVVYDIQNMYDGIYLQIFKLTGKVSNNVLPQNIGKKINILLFACICDDIIQLPASYGDIEIYDDLYTALQSELKIFLTNQYDNDESFVNDDLVNDEVKDEEEEDKIDEVPDPFDLGLEPDLW